MVPRLRGIVEELALARAYDILERRAAHLGGLKQLVHRVDVLLVMLAMMQLERLGRDHRLERIFGIGKRRQVEMQLPHGLCSRGRHARSPERDRFRSDRAGDRWFLAYEDLTRRSFLTELTPPTFLAAASARSAMSLLSTKPESCTTPL